MWIPGRMSEIGPENEKFSRFSKSCDSAPNRAKVLEAIIRTSEAARSIDQNPYENSFKINQI